MCVVVVVKHIRVCCTKFWIAGIEGKVVTKPDQEAYNSCTVVRITVLK